MYKVVVKQSGHIYDYWIYRNELYAKMIVLKWNDIPGFSAEIIIV